MKVLVTGAAGFIGMHVARRLLERGDHVVGVDNLNDYYDPKLKRARLAQLEPFREFRFVQADITDQSAMEALFSAERFNRVVNLAAQPGVRYSLENPQAYIQSNLVGFGNILEGCRHHGIEHLVYASSSSVYGANTRIPFSVHDNVDHPVSLYAATKKANELMAHSYAHLYNLPVSGLRFFTVYGPWGRPDMAYFKFVQKMVNGQSIDIYNYGNCERDFTYIDDIVEGVLRVLDRPAVGDPDWDGENPAVSLAPYRIYNIGNHTPVKLMHFVETLEKVTGIVAEKSMLPAQPGDVRATYADISDLMQETGFKPATSLEKGLSKFWQWYSEYYRA